MKLDSIKTAITSKAGRKILVVQKHSPAIMFGAGLVGVVATAVLASKATLKLEDKLDEALDNIALAKRVAKHEESHEDSDPHKIERKKQRDIAGIYIKSSFGIIKLYAPAVAVGTLSVAALTGSHVVLTRRNVGLTAAYAALEKGFDDYRQRVRDELGEEKDRQFRYKTETVEIVEETETGPQTSQVVRVAPDGHSVYARFFDEYCQSWSKQPEYNHLFLRCQQNYANDLLRSRGHIFLNEVYDMLGIERSKAGAVVGWLLSKDGDNFVDFGIFDGDNPRARDFVNGREGSILLDFNVDGVIFDKLPSQR